ncbi:MAG: hypothetical protein J6Y02_24090 [Pseudobutyrivibrio sp.]|nr:hypothetical protein [Pseudobutyrivibrio sp.]
MSEQIQMIYSDNPYMDVLVFNTKLLASGAVVKNQTEADRYETVDTIKASDIYLRCVEGTTYFELLIPYPSWVFDVCTSITDERLREICKQNNEMTPEYAQEEVCRIYTNYILNNYDEHNEYYRKLNGLPPLGETHFIYITQDDLPEDVYISDITLPVHKMDDYSIDVLEEFGILNRLRKENPKATYLNYLGYHKISIYKARKATPFELLYLPGCEVEEIRREYIERYEVNVEFILKTVYSQAFKFQSDYYDNFISLLITIQTMIDIITNVQINILKKEIFDSRTLRYLFESYGIPYYSEIPMKYQVAMIKNIHTLLKYKSTNRNIVDICSLFGYDNIQIFKYYLLKDRSINEDEISGYDKEAFELKFIKVPLQESVDDYTRDPTNYIPYDNVTMEDEFWDGDKPHSEVQKEIEEKNFSLVRTKYLSVDSLCDLTEITFNICYFFNFIFDKVKLEEQLVCYVPFIRQGKAFRMTDLFVFLTCINFYYLDVEDEIMDTQGKILYIKGFNFMADMAELAQYIKDNHLTEELAKLAGFTVPASSILTYKQMLEIFIGNKNVYTHITEQMRKAPNMRIYKIYKHLYDSMMILEYTNEYFKKPDGTVAKTYTEYMKYRDPTLYTELVKLRNITDLDHRRTQIINMIDHIIYALDECFNNDDILRFIYRYFPSHGEELIQRYILKVINFFKSYKTQMLNITVVYVIDDRLENHMLPYDNIADLLSLFHIDEKDPIKEKIYYDVWSIWEERDSQHILDKIKIDIDRLVAKYYPDNYEIRDEIETYVTKILDDFYKYYDNIDELLASFIFGTKLTIGERFGDMIASFDANDSCKPTDKVSIQSFKDESGNI